MAAVRPKLAMVPSGADRVWGTAESAPPASSSFLDLRSSSSVGTSAAGQSSATAAKGKAPAAPQPNVKKMRRRVALLSGVHLNLPSSPVVGPSPPGSSREMAWTFTAEWDSAHDEIIFSEVEGGFSPISSSSSSSSSSSVRLIASPVPFDVSEDEVFELDMPGAPPVAPSPPFSDMLSSSSSSCASPSSPSALASPFSPSMSAVSEIFDFYLHTPHTLSFSHHERTGSASTAPSSPVGPSSPVEQLPPSYADSRHDQPVISVTFFQEPDNPARGRAQGAQVGEGPGPATSTVDPYAVDVSAITEKKRRVLPPPPSISHVARRPLPPVPVRAGAADAGDVSASRRSAPQPSVWDDRAIVTLAQSLQGGARRMPSSYAAHPFSGVTHARAASLGHERPKKNAEPLIGPAPGKHFRSISAVLTRDSQRAHH
ncbi:hypothetical protein C8Q77DRAFT_1161274 [Trametes polyzona]|nr:hypothetical protein C8Q77DRAFT_1161274 [Trametes polyzona]